MIRYPLDCGGCGARILVRLGVGFAEREPFEFQCEVCSQIIRGALALDQENARVEGIVDLVGAAIASSEEGYRFTFTYHPAYGSPTRADPGVVAGLGPVASPFIEAFRRRGVAALISAAKAERMRQFAKNDANDLARIIENYRSQNWGHFSEGIAKYLPSFETSLPIDRNRALYQLLELAMGPIASCEAHVEYVEGQMHLVARLRQRESANLDQFLDWLEGDGRLQELQYDALDLIPRFLRLADDLTPALAEWDPENPDVAMPTEIRIHRVHRFHALKSFYVDAYEVVARSLTVAFGLINLDERGDPDAFPVHPTTRRFQPSSLGDFARQDHAPKVSLVKSHPLFGPWAGALDSKLRNGIGHNSARPDQRTGVVTYPVGRSGTPLATITIGDFLLSIIRSAYRAHQANHLIKLMYVHRYLRNGG
jgi:hypothetical protein